MRLPSLRPERSASANFATPACFDYTEFRAQFQELDDELGPEFQNIEICMIIIFI